MQTQRLRSSPYVVVKIRSYNPLLPSADIPVELVEELPMTDEDGDVLVIRPYSPPSSDQIIGKKI